VPGRPGELIAEYGEAGIGAAHVSQQTRGCDDRRDQKKNQSDDASHVDAADPTCSEWGFLDRGLPAVLISVVGNVRKVDAKTDVGTAAWARGAGGTFMVITDLRLSPACTTRATAQREQRRTADLIPDWLTFPTTSTYTAAEPIAVLNQLFHSHRLRHKHSQMT
jgi:hypothetical protein